ncbi:MAG: acyl carrier protein [Oscillospiraceae bacterium]|nr:acyl carrier protein [Oscillospiraceae bacterium]MDD4367734.1 acyl carrier protein [Oscillospiraceae bacterium]
MSKQEISDIVTQTIAQAAAMDPAEVKADSDLIADLNMDSLAVFELVVDLETAFDLQISDEDVETLHTPMQIINYIAARVKLD